MIGPLDSMLEMIKASPAIANNPQMQSYIEVLESGDSKRGEEIANNLLKTYGMTKDDALAQARAFFHLM